MKIAALIPARAGSKRLPFKNIKSLGGKPLLFWSIDIALACNTFDSVVLSTESEEVATIVRNHYPVSEVEILIRPPELSTDSADLRDVCIHFLEQAPHIEFLSLMMPTFPFREAQRIISEIIPPLYSRQIDRVISVRTGNYATFDYWMLNKDRFKRMYTGAPLWCGAGNASYHFQKRDYFFLPPHKWPYLLGERTLRIQTNFLESVDIDTPDDFKEAEKVCAGYRPQPTNMTVFEDETIELVAPQGADFTSFRQYLDAKGIKTDLPVLILRPANPLFTFLRWYECNSSMSYTTEDTNKLIAKLPASGHSQDFPVHYIHSPCYRVLRKEQDKHGIPDDTVPSSQVVFEGELKQAWPGYVEPIAWIAPQDD